MRMSIRFEVDNGYLAVMVEISHGGYCGQFYFDHNMNYLGAIEIYNPPWGKNKKAALAAIILIKFPYVLNQ